MTLIELMVVIALIGLASAAVVLGAGSITGAELKNATLRVVAASRFASARAVTRGTTTRLRFDLEQNTLAVEEAEGPLVLARDDDRTLATPEDDEAGDGIVDPWQAAEARLGTTLKPAIGTSPFGPIRGRDQEPLERYAAAPLGRKVEVTQLAAMHLQDPAENGEASIYFFPSGLATEAVVWLAAGKGQLSVVVHPLTGRARIEQGAFELVRRTEDAFDEDASELRDPS